LKSFINDFNNIGESRTPSFFIIDYKKEYYHIYNLNSCNDKSILYDIDNLHNLYSTSTSNITPSHTNIKDVELQSTSFKEYKDKFDTIQNNIKDGNTYLLNLTQPTILKSKKEIDLKDIFYSSDARFRLYFKNKDIEFSCFSPEEFVSITDNTIYTYPMKGTIEVKDSDDLKVLEEELLNNPKELAEHTMIVDLLRNDLGQIASKVKVEDFRYISKIKAGQKELLQTSSKISAKLEDNWQDNLGNILDKLLPAGSITGTPKKATMKIIEDVEGYDRGYFSGIFGYFDGKNLKSAVMIRYIEKKDDKTIYKSGGGITIDSKAEDEYQEMLDKIYF